MTCRMRERRGEGWRSLCEPAAGRGEDVVVPFVLPLQKNSRCRRERGSALLRTLDSAHCANTANPPPPSSPAAAPTPPPSPPPPSPTVSSPPWSMKLDRDSADGGGGGGTICSSNASLWRSVPPTTNGRSSAASSSRRRCHRQEGGGGVVGCRRRVAILRFLCASHHHSLTAVGRCFLRTASPAAPRREGSGCDSGSCTMVAPSWPTQRTASSPLADISPAVLLLCRAPAAAEEARKTWYLRCCLAAAVSGC